MQKHYRMNCPLSVCHQMSCALKAKDPSEPQLSECWKCTQIITNFISQHGVHVKSLWERNPGGWQGLELFVEPSVNAQGTFHRILLGGL